MAKAYDSIRLLLLLQRISLPDTFNKWILNLFQDRNMRVITSFGFSDPFTAANGIDQGDSISPLI